MTARIWPVDAVAGAPSYSGRALRQTGVAPFVGGATASRPLGARSGVRPGTVSPVVVTSSTVITLGAFAGVIDGEAAAEAGPYAFSFDASQAVNIAAANASNPRIDLISVQVSDPAEADGSSTPSIAPVYTQGTAAASPTQPATPARSFPVVRVNVPTSGGGNPTVTWIAPFFTAPGGILPVDTLANLNTVTGSVGQHATVYADSTAGNNGDYLWSSSLGQWLPFSIGPVAWTPVLGGTTTNPNIGSTGVATGWYTLTGKECSFSISLDINGSGLTNGSGNFYFTLPFTPSTAYNRQTAVGIFDKSGSADPGAGHGSMVGIINGGTAQIQGLRLTDGSRLSSSTGLTAGTFMSIAGSYVIQ